MKKLGMNIAMLAAVAVAFNVSAQDAPDNQPQPADTSGAQDAVVMPVPVTTESMDTGAATVGGGNAQPAESETRPPESFVKEGTSSPRYVAPMKRDTNSAAPTTASIRTPATPTDKVVKDGEKGILMNFRNAPLDMVLSHLSDVAGFIVIPKVDVKSKVTVWSNQPLTKDEAVELLNKVLAEEGYAVLRDNRTLTIVTQSDAKRRNETPVKMGYEPTTIPKDMQVVTQIIPVRFINAVQLAKDLQPLMPAQTTMTANEGGNALVITDTQQNIHRLAEIIKALDTTVSSLSSVKVFQLKYADAKTVADMVKEVFANSGDTSRSGGGGRGRFQFGGGGPFGAMFGGGGGGDNSNNGGRPGASKVVATADDRSNSLVVSAPDDLMPTIEQLVASVDTNVEDVTEIRVFRLKFADPQETADLLASLFPDTTSSQNQRGGGGFFRGGPFGFGGGTDTSGSTQSDRMKKQSKVIAVPDKRTGSVVVTAARDTMEQIGKMLEQLDADPARKQKVHVYTLENVDPTVAQQQLEALFSGQSTSSSSRNSSGTTGTQLNTRAQRQNQNTGTRTSGSSSFGGSTGSSGTRSFGN